jgi:hypothetical protein
LRAAFFAFFAFFAFLAIAALMLFDARNRAVAQAMADSVGAVITIREDLGRREFPQTTSEGSSYAERRPGSDVWHALILSGRSIAHLFLLAVFFEFPSQDLP